MTAQILPYKNILPKIGENVWIAPGSWVVGDVEIADDVGIWFNCVLRGDVNNIKIGARTNIQDGTVIHVSSTLQGTYVGSDVTVGHAALLHACTIEDAAFIGMQACVMDGAHVESGAMVGSGGAGHARQTCPDRAALGWIACQIHARPHGGGKSLYPVFRQTLR
ncbi:MAG TPA: gamma carbonic anhydrase family protein [Alphaproteobacteria bacterium]|nr:gamma carbonic anhydrase family protein [Alphaproteobacteria bacterium]